jgi:hypothetical protein
MKWSKTQRASGIVEFCCEHGCGHPTFESARAVALKYEGAAKEITDPIKFRQCVESWMTHGCDGCCRRDDFPGARTQSGE